MTAAAPASPARPLASVDMDEGHPVRQATASDAPTLGRLLWAFNTEYETPTDQAQVLADRFARMLQGRDAFALLAGEDDGFALVTLRPAIWFDGPIAQLEELYVGPERRSQGIGSALLSAARHLVEERGAPEINIIVDESDRASQRFYERHGFATSSGGVRDRMLFYAGPSEETAEIPVVR